MFKSFTFFNLKQNKINSGTGNSPFVALKLALHHSMNLSITSSKKRNKKKEIHLLSLLVPIYNFVLRFCLLSARNNKLKLIHTFGENGTPSITDMFILLFPSSLSSCYLRAAGTPCFVRISAHQGWGTGGQNIRARVVADPENSGGGDEHHQI